MACLSSIWAETWLAGRESPPAAGTVATLKYGGVLHDDGTASQDNLRSAAATDKYILKGEGSDVWEPRFTYRGLRYVQVEGYPGTPDVSATMGKVVRSSVRQIGEFRCSHSLMNDIHDCAVRTEASNLHSIPTDCPQRDERMGWLNDMTVRAEEAMYNFDSARVYTNRSLLVCGRFQMETIGCW